MFRPLLLAIIRSVHHITHNFTFKVCLCTPRCGIPNTGQTIHELTKPLKNLRYFHVWSPKNASNFFEVFVTFTPVKGEIISKRTVGSSLPFSRYAKLARGKKYTCNKTLLDRHTCYILISSITQ